MLARDVTLLIDKVDPAASVDSGLVTLMPGETWTFHVPGVDALDAEAVRDPRVLRSANQLVAGVSPSDAAPNHYRVDSV